MRIFVYAALVTAACMTSVSLATMATGGSLISTNGFRIHTFTNSGTLAVSQGGQVEVLVVGGAGGGGAGRANASSGGGGGGAGGVVYSNAFAVSSGSIAVTVGGGGAGASSGGKGGNGTASSFSTITAGGGGGGASSGGSAAGNGAAAAGSGGGGSWNGDGGSGGSVLAFGSGAAGGYGGGACSGSRYAGGGGGGAGGAGSNNPAQYGAGGAGGPGVSNSISGTTMAYAGGGGGGVGGWWVTSGGAGGSGVGGKGGYYLSGSGPHLMASGATGAAGTGSGGGGGAGCDSTDSPVAGGNGGSGIVIVRYSDAGAPVVSNSGGATGISTRAAWLTATLVSTGSFDTVWGMVWGTNNPGATLNGWQGGGAFEFGAGAEGQSTSVMVNTLAPESTFYYMAWAANAGGTNPGTPSSFTTFSLRPSIINSGVSNVLDRAATVYGTLVSTGESPSTVFVGYGTNAAALSFTNTAGVCDQGTVTNRLMNLVPNVTNFYRFAASNEAGWGYAASTGAVVLLPVPGSPAESGSLFNPSNRPLLAQALVMTNGTLAIDTGDGIARWPSMRADSGTYYGSVLPGSSGNVWLAFFNFGQVELGTGVVCTVTGNLGLAIGCTGDMSVACAIDVSGDSASTNRAFIAMGGAGAEAGVAAAGFVSAPPDSNHGRGGFGRTNGWGFGGSKMHDNTYYTGVNYCSGGAGYGGAGGRHAQGVLLGINGGTNYGDSLLSVLYGGSGAGGVANAGRWYSGGAGGGAVELVAGGSLTVSGSIRANGGSGLNIPDYNFGSSGGSGGGILLAANRLAVSGVLEAAGGAGAAPLQQCGGGGGGGRIALYGNILNLASSNFSAAGGITETAYARAGSNGTIRFTGDGLCEELRYPFDTTPTAPLIACVTASGIDKDSALLIGRLDGTGGSPATVYCTWWTNGGSAVISNLGVSATGFITNPATGLEHGATYMWTFIASNAAGTASGRTNVFTTLTGWPAVSNVLAAALSPTSAVVSGYLSHTGMAETTVYTLHRSVGAQLWFTNETGPSVVGSVTNTLTGLVENTLYEYRFAASNSYGWAVAPESGFFETMPALSSAAQTNSIWNPTNYPLLAGSLMATGGTLVIDTGDGTNRGPRLSVAGSEYRGLTVPSQTGGVWLAMFNFGRISLSSQVVCSVTGNLGLVLSSTGAMSVACALSVDGTPAPTNNQIVSDLETNSVPGGPGAESGSPELGSFRSSPPDSFHGHSGCGVESGYGYGGSLIVSNGSSYSGGAGYGGAGGQHVGNSAPGGVTYGDAMLRDLYGGSGAGGQHGSAGQRSSGGGGGGALELVSSTGIDIPASGLITANGGAGGTPWDGTSGGSGGGVLLAAPVVTVAGRVEANGGVGGIGRIPAGGGGGGRIAVYADTIVASGSVFSAAGGAGYYGAGSGTNGTILYTGSGAGVELRYPYSSAGTLLPQISSMAATGITSRSAWACGRLDSTGGGTTTIYLRHGPDTNSWLSTNLGVATAGMITHQVDGLTSTTTYWYAYVASNAAGPVTSPAVSYVTPGSVPVLSNGAVTGITRTNATVGGWLSSTGDSVAAVFLLHGRQAGQWDAAVPVAFAGPGALSCTLTGLSNNAVYYYSYAGSNDAGWGYAPSTNWFATGPGTGLPSGSNSLWNPSSYRALAPELRVSGGLLQIDTGDGLTRCPLLIANGAVYPGEVVSDASGRVRVALFDFGSVWINSNVTCSVTGNLGLALLSQSYLTICSTVDVSGCAGVDGLYGSPGAGGPGAEGGSRLASFSSYPPGSQRGSGGAHFTDGVGYGAGSGGGWLTLDGQQVSAEGFGGGYGGFGGSFTGGVDNISAAHWYRGYTYGDSRLTSVYGGSGGGGGGISSPQTGNGGGGGGTLTLIGAAGVNITSGAVLRANGGDGSTTLTADSRCGGGGSGGAVLIAGNRVTIAGRLEAAGGNGGRPGSIDFVHGGAGGGGGRIAIYVNHPATNGMITAVQGGESGLASLSQAGSSGTVWISGDHGYSSHRQSGTVIVLW